MNKLLLSFVTWLILSPANLYSTPRDARKLLCGKNLWIHIKGSWNDKDHPPEATMMRFYLDGRIVILGGTITKIKHDKYWIGEGDGYGVYKGTWEKIPGEKNKYRIAFKRTHTYPHVTLPNSKELDFPQETKVIILKHKTFIMDDEIFMTTNKVDEIQFNKLISGALSGVRF